jgi:hypothetical protein
MAFVLRTSGLIRCRGGGQGAVGVTRCGHAGQRSIKHGKMGAEAHVHPSKTFVGGRITENRIPPRREAG